ncbi:AAA family ATPase [Yersinia pekkanenii]|uniref:Phage ATP/GTP-binding protein n=1 Tax=Yersinia pekkanenii TaxID=1288385 RepID=A0A0T9NWS2_9GAMM|nr:AAA family ATPase [Yersinia pekkanenii]CNH34139.1 phage ATP/GTP-binding protein [Yersinia pekkanenii]CRY69730.1 phage ATP/GTP-binding protein [Yersinia pekkanenii]
MGTATLILGESGTGKSTSLRNLNPDDCLLIQVVRKRLPFKSNNWQPWDATKKTGSIIATHDWSLIREVINRATKYGKKIVIIDDFQYVMCTEFMETVNDKGFDKFAKMGLHMWEIIKAAQDAPDDLRIYFMAHTEETNLGRVKMKTIGKMLDEKVTVEGMFTIVLRTTVHDGQYFFTTQNNGYDTVKSPMGLFETNEIENDLLTVDRDICDYYGINNVHQIKGNAA